MQINIHIDGRLATVFGNRAVRKALFVAAVMVPCMAVAATSVPNTFQSGTTISSADMNANFSSVTSSLNTLDGRLTVLEATKALPSANSVLAYAGTSVGDGALTRQFNSSNGTVVLAGSGGSYTVTFNGIDCGTTTGTGIALAQASGASGISCRVNGDWGNVNGSCRVFVGCFNTAGNLTTTPFSLIYAR